MADYKHFSHPHDLKLYHILEDQPNKQFHCSGCESACHGLVHGCRSCEFFLHKACATAPRSLLHPSHLSHHLTLLPSPTYPDGSFLCNACGATGTAFSFSCIPCDLDLHVDCALLPQQLNLNTHHRHNLSLLFSPPSSVCNLCRRAIDSQYWSYSCSICNFHVHTYCATAPVGGVRNDRYTQLAAGGERDYESVSPATARYGVVDDRAAPVNPPVVEDPFLKAQAELHELQMQMQIVNEMAKMMASVNLSSLAP